MVADARFICMEADVALYDLSHTNEKADLIYIDPPFSTGRDMGAFDDRWKPGQHEKLLIDVMERAKGCLAETGNFVLHVDPRTSHLLKLSGDDIFGASNFRNEVIWAYASGGASKRHLSRKHDVLLWWSMGENYTFNVLREPYATGNVEGRKGFHPEGRMLTDVWSIPFISTTSKERVGYPTQKPLALLHRVVQVWSNLGDLVVDPMCGSGTTGVAAVQFGRRALLIDKNPDAISLARARIKQTA